MKNTHRPDICLVLMPYGFSYNMPSPSISAVKPMLENAGYDVQCMDLNSKYVVRNGMFDKDLLKTTCAVSYGEFLDTVSPDYLKFLDEMVDKIVRMAPWVVGFSFYFRPAWHASSYVAAKVKRHLDCTIVAGGASIDTTVIGVFQRETPASTFDMFMHGESELSLLELLGILKEKQYPGSLDEHTLTQLVRIIPGSFSLKDPILCPLNIRKDVVQNLDDLPLPDFSDSDLSVSKTLPVTLARGCTARCAFCSSRRTHPEFRMMSGKRAVMVVLHLQETYGINNFYFSSPLINGDINKLRDMCNEVIKNNLHFTFSGLVRLSKQVREEDIELMCVAGFRWIKFGLESGSGYVRKTMGKLEGQDHVYRLLKRTSESGSIAAVNIMHSFPTETEEHFNETIEFISQFTPKELAWEGWPFNLGHTNNALLDRAFVKKFDIAVHKVRELTPGKPTFALDVEWSNINITGKIRHDRQRRLQAFRDEWLK